MPPVRWGIIGPGSIAHNFADALKESYSGKLQAIASLNRQRREEFGNKYNIENQFRFNTYDQLLNSNDVDAVYISTPPTLHAEWTIKAAGKRKHVLCEKPLSLKLKEVKFLISLSKKNKKFLFVDYPFIYSESVSFIKNIIAKKKLGKALF